MIFIYKWIALPVDGFWCTDEFRRKI